MADEQDTPPEPKRPPGRPPRLGPQPHPANLNAEGLTPREAWFVREYLVDLNAAAAAIRTGSNARSAASIGHHLLKRPHVSAALQAAFKARLARIEAQSDDVLRELDALWQASDIRNFASWDGGRVTLRPSTELTPAQAACVAEVYQGPEGIRLKLHDKLRALELAMRHRGMFPSTHISANGLNMEVAAGDQVVIFLPDNGRQDIAPALPPPRASLNGWPHPDPDDDGQPLEEEGPMAE
jgi:phage terminase small subunit